MVDVADLEGAVPGGMPGDGEVHVWYFRLDAPDSGARGLLSPAEQARADRFLRALHGTRFAAGRAILRRILAAYLDRDPASLTFDYGDHGKPRLGAAWDGMALAFNASHSGDAGACAVARDGAVGVDLEEMRENREFLKIARRYFAPDEVRQLTALPADEQHAAFYQCWTAKEALIKAWGRGLSTPLDRFTVQVAPAETALLALDLPEYANGAWHLQALPPVWGAAAALACKGRPHTVRVRRYTISG